MIKEPYMQQMFSIKEWECYGNKKGFVPLEQIEQKVLYKYGQPGGKLYNIQKYVRDHKDDFCWKLVQVLKALFFTVITLGIYLIGEKGQNLWLEAYYSKEIIGVKEKVIFSRSYRFQDLPTGRIKIQENLPIKQTSQNLVKLIPSM